MKRNLLVKRLIQIALIVVLVCVMFQSVRAGSMFFAGDATSGPVGSTSLIDETNTYVAVCTPGSRSVICTRPNVGWNT
jgi:hypothetical protein